jgi:uncharacterized membrane protein YphA (DoxX/SURF4 family)
MLSPETVAIFLARSLLAILFIFQGYDKLFRIGPYQVAQTILPAFEKYGMTLWLARFLVWMNCLIELTCGLLLLAGLLKYFSLTLLGINLLVVSAGLSLVNPVWDMKLVFPRLFLLIFVLLFPDRHDVITLTHLVNQLFS